MKNFSSTAIVLVGLLVTAFSGKQSDVPQRPEDIKPLMIGASISKDLILSNYEGKTYDLTKAIQAKPTILIFYRGGWCPYCNQQLWGLQEIERELIGLGYQLIAVSPDKPEELRKTLTKNKLNYLLLSDSKMITAQKMGIAYKDSHYGNMLVKASGEEHHLLPVPAVFLLNKKGVINFEYVNPDITERLHPQLLLAAARLEAKAEK